jgi:hypothetical protein
MSTQLFHDGGEMSMGNSQINSAYIVHSQVIGLNDQPFPPKEKLRSVWHPLFNNKNCFTDLCKLIDFGAYSEINNKRIISSIPFICNLGPVLFNTRSVRLVNSFEREWLGQSLCGTDDDDFIEDDERLFFGYDSQLEDQRMNYLCFEIYNPLFLRAKTKDETQVEGKIFLHIYPSGYLVFHVAVALNWRDGRNLKGLHKILKETRPWRKDSNWTWSSKLGSGRLPEIIKIIKNKIQQSFYVDSFTPLQQGTWWSSLKLVSAAEGKHIATELLLPDNKYEIVDMRGKSTSLKYLYSSRQGLVCIFQPTGTWPEYKRKIALHLFWKILVLTEFVAFKNKLYEDYAKFLRREVNQLKDFRLSLKRKATKEDLFRFSAYDPTIPQFLLALDNHIQSARPFHRFIYSTISTGTGFDERREKVMKLINEWEEEVEQWEPILISLWKKIISPVRSLLAQS